MALQSARNKDKYQQQNIRPPVTNRKEKNGVYVPRGRSNQCANFLL